MNILLLHPQKATRDMLSFCIETEVGATVHVINSFQEAMDHFLGDSEINLVITSQHPETEKLFKYILSTGAEVFVVLLSEDPSEPVDAYPDLKILAKMNQSDAATKLVPILKDQFRKILEARQASEYCRIDPSLLMRVVPLRGDVYIRLSSVKFVKLYKTGAKFGKEDLERVTVKKKITSLYIKKSETPEFIDKFKIELQSLIDQADASLSGEASTSLIETAGQVQDVVFELTSRLGFTPEVRELAQQNVKLTLRAIGASPRLSKALDLSQFKNKNYLSSHSIMLAHLTCSIASQMQWPSDTTFHKLVLASLFHDNGLQDPMHAKIIHKGDVEALKTSVKPEDFTTVHTHGIKAAELVQSLREIPSDVDTILLQHHERPDGSGFPVGLKSAQIAPLSAVFIVAHEIIDALVSQKNNFSMENFLSEKKELYQLGTFKKIWKMLAHAEAEDEDAAKEEAA